MIQQIRYEWCGVWTQKQNIIINSSSSSLAPFIQFSGKFSTFPNTIWADWRQSPQGFSLSSWSQRRSSSRSHLVSASPSPASSRHFQTQSDRELETPLTWVTWWCVHQHCHNHQHCHGSPGDVVIIIMIINIVIGKSGSCTWVTWWCQIMVDAMDVIMFIIMMAYTQNSFGGYSYSCWQKIHLPSECSWSQYIADIFQNDIFLAGPDILPIYLRCRTAVLL